MEEDRKDVAYMTIVSSEVKSGGEKQQGTVPHNLVLENRRHLTAVGVMNVDTYDEESIAANTQGGPLLIRGKNLHLDRLNTETGELTVSGEICSMSYGESRPQGSFFSRLFR